VGLVEDGREGKLRQGSSDSLEEDGPCSSLLDRVGQDRDTLGDNEEALAEDEAKQESLLGMVKEDVHSLEVGSGRFC
jgi:hypothetical protein